MAKRNFDLRKPDTLLMSEDIDEALYSFIDEKLLRKILLWGKLINVSDIAFQEGMPVIIKKNNLVFPITRGTLDTSVISRFLGIIYGAKDGDDSAFQRVMSVDDTNTTYVFKVGDSGTEKQSVRYRVNCIRDAEGGASIRMRLNNEQILKLEDIGLTEASEIYQNMFPVKGLNLVTGSVDSGKTTLIYACLGNFIERDPRSAFIDTFESPIEGNLKAVAQKAKVFNKIVNQCPVPIGVKSFSQGVEEALRRNTDIILAGEVRKPDEAVGLVQGVLSTGKLLMATLHTDNIPVTFSRLLEMLHSDNEGKMRSMIYDLISSMNMIVSQKLLTTVDLSRVAVNEVLVFTKEIKKRLNSIPIEKVSSEIEKIMLESGSTMVDKAESLRDQGIISEETFLKFKDSFSY
jgi:Tfp pilus assembly pilus retraction ATPase PilT